jgi:pimeloyl-ACP methyl ester carboxylesterase
MRTTTWRLADRVRVSGGEVAAGVFGEGPPIVLVHGTPAWSYLWRGVVPVLARNHAVHVWDMLGFGDSRPDQGVAPSIARQARTLAELVEYWGLTEPTLVGHDIGGGVVLRAHLVDGVPARRLGMIDAAVLGPWNTPFTEHMQRYSDAYRTMPTHVFADIVRARLHTAVHKSLSPDVLAEYLRPWTGEAGQQRWIDQVVSVSHTDTTEAVRRLDEIRAPTLVLWGEHDTWLDPAVGDRLAAAIPGAHLRTVPGAGHFLPEDAPDAIADALQELLS